MRTVETVELCAVLLPPLLPLLLFVVRALFRSSFVFSIEETECLEPVLDEARTFEIDVFSAVVRKSMRDCRSSSGPDAAEVCADRRFADLGDLGPGRTWDFLEFLQRVGPVAKDCRG